MTGATSAVASAEPTSEAIHPSQSMLLPIGGQSSLLPPFPKIEEDSQELFSGELIIEESYAVNISNTALELPYYPLNTIQLTPLQTSTSAASTTDSLT